MEFDPNAAQEAIDKDPAEMTPEERNIAAAHALYEVRRLMVGVNAAVEYLAELVGMPSEDVRSISDRAELDEFRELGEEDDEDADEDIAAAEYVVRESYAEAEAAGDDLEGDSAAVFEGTKPLPDWPEEGGE